MTILPSSTGLGELREKVARAIHGRRYHLDAKDTDSMFAWYAERPEGTDKSRVAIYAAYKDADAVLSVLGAAQRPIYSGQDTIRTAAKALDYLADHTRPIGGQETYNAEHLIQIAFELREMANAAPQPASNAGGTEAALKMVAGLFAESVHETYTREEVVNIVEDMMRLGSPVSSTGGGSAA